MENIQVEKQTEVDVKTVVKGQYVEYGEWRINCDGYYPYCSNCMSEPPGRVMTDFCPVCGVKMRGKEND